MQFTYYKEMDSQMEADGTISFSGILDDEIHAVIEGLYKKIDFSKTVDIFREKQDLFAAGEFWGKLMRGGCAMYAVTKDPVLKTILDCSMNDMLSVQKPDGEISATPRAAQPNGTHGSDMWERKYVLLGMYAYYKVFGGKHILDAMCALADYTCAQVGRAPKTPITETGWAFCGIESSSILEPIVKLYGLTGKANYLELARHIVEETGCCSRENIFEAILAGKSPKDIGGTGVKTESIAKAYEMMSCFEGLCEYYRATGEAKYLRVIRLFFDCLLEEEITLLGSGGADAPYNLGPGTGEQWNYTRYEQTNPDITLSMETCVTITWMKLCLQYLRLTGDARAADQIEISYYNALSGALRPDGGFFDYFPQFNGVRGSKVNFTYDIGGMPLSCCTANGPAGYGMLGDAACMRTLDGVVLNLYLPGSYENDCFGLRVEGTYPAGETVTVSVLYAPLGKHTISFRIPAYCNRNAFTIHTVPHVQEASAAEHMETGYRNGYAYITREWKKLDQIVIKIPHTLRVVKAPHGSNRKGDAYFALTYGPLVMARDARFDAAFDQPLPLPAEDAVLPCVPLVIDGVKAAVETVIGEKKVTLVDYASAGKTWDAASAYRSWFPIA